MKQKPTKWFYICERGGLCKHPCNENCFYTTDFFKSKLYRSLIKPGGWISFAKSARKDIDEWYEINSDKNYPLPPMDKKNAHFSTTYHDLENWALSNTANQILNNRAPSVEITFKDGRKKLL